MTSTFVQPAASHMPPSAGNVGARAIIVVIAVLLGVLVARLDEPSAKPASQASALEFSAERALNDVKAISRAPHPIGSAEHDRVERYIVQALSAAGLSPQIQKATAANRNAAVAASIENVVAVVKGSQPGKAVLLVAHYDSVPTGPGASDDSAAVASLLETARISQSLPRPKRDIEFLFTDGEEIGLLGAEAFVSENPAARNVGLVLNFEARGTSGPVILFEASDRNGWLIENFSKAVPRPVANSLSYEIYKRLPNTTDFTVFKNAGYDGLNFAFIDGLVRYHTATDTVQNLDPGSLQQQGTYAVKLAQWFANLEQWDSREGRAVYFDILGRVLVHYSLTAALVTVLFAVLLLSFALFLGFQRGYLTFQSLALAVAVMVTAVIGATAAAMGMQQITDLLQARFSHARAGVLYHGGYYVSAFLLLGVGTAVAAYMWAPKRQGSGHSMAGAGLLVWLGLALFVSLSAPSAGYLFVWPLLFNTSAWIAALYTGGKRRSTVLTAAALTATTVLLAPMAYKIFAAFAIGAGSILSALCAVFLGLCVYHLREAIQRSWVVPVSLYGAGAALFVIALVSWDFDRNSPRFDSLFFGVEADTHKSIFASYDARTDEWTSRFLGAGSELKKMPIFLPWSSRKFLQSPAQDDLLLLPPQVSLLGDKPIPGGREVRLQIKSARHAPVLSLFLNAEQQVLRASVNGKDMSPARSGARAWSMQYYGASAEGIDVVLRVQTSGAIHMQVEDVSYGLPEEATAARGPRPDNTVPAPVRFTDSTLVTKEFLL